MADTSAKASAEARTTESRPTAVRPAVLPPAGEASNPEVHRLLAVLEGARLNKDDTAANDLIKQIADLGYRAS